MKRAASQSLSNTSGEEHNQNEASKEEERVRNEEDPDTDGSGRKRPRQNEVPVSDAVRAVDDSQSRLLLQQLQQEQRMRTLAALSTPQSVSATGDISQYLRAHAASLESTSSDSNHHLSPSFLYSSLAQRNPRTDAELMQDLLLRYGVGGNASALSNQPMATATSASLPYRTMTAQSLSEAQLRMQLAAMNANALAGSNALADAQFFSGAGRGDSRLQSMEAQVQQNQHLLLRELATMQMLEHRPPAHPWLTGTNTSSSSLLESVLPQLSSSLGADASSSHTASLLSQRGSTLANAAGMSSEHYLNHLIASVGMASSSGSPNRSLVSDSPHQRLHSPRGAAEAPAPAAVSASSKPSKKKAPPIVVEANYDPGVVKDLSLPSDPENLSEYQCLLRQQIVLFAVAMPDIQCSAQGRNKPITLGQVGVLCRYCAKIPPGMRPCGAVYFPAKLSGLYQASQNMAINHFSNNCQSIPETIRTKLLQLKERKSTVLGGGKHFWANGARVMGVVENENQLRFAEQESGEEEKEEKK